MSLYNDLSDVLTPYANKIKEVNESLDAVERLENIPITSWVNGSYITTSGSTVDLTPTPSSEGFRHAVLDASEGDKFIITVTGGINPRAWCFVDASLNVLSVSAASVTCSGTEIIAPANAAKVILNDKSRTSTKSYRVTKISSFVDATNEALTSLDKTIPLINTYNLLDPNGFLPYDAGGYIKFKSDYYIEVIPGKTLLCNRYKGYYTFFDASKTQISNVSYTDMFTPMVVPENAKYLKMSYNGSFTSYDSEILVYYSENEISPADDRRSYIKHKLINGEVINNDVYKYTYPESDTSEFMNRVKYSILRDIRKSENTIRIGCFNIFISRQFYHWDVLKQELKDHAIDICGFEEVRYGDSVGQVKRRLPEFLKSWQFPYGSYHDPQVQPTSNKALSSHWEVLSTTEYVYPSNADGSFIKCVIKLPRYRDCRDGVNSGAIELLLSVYVYHATSSKGVSVRLSEISDILNVISLDTSDFIVVVGDANAFDAGVDSEGKTAEWEAWKTGGFTPIYDTRDINTVGNSTNWNCPYDNIFMGQNITCKGFDIVPSSNYKVTIPGSDTIVSISDHDLLYADLVFDFDAVIEAKIEAANSTNE